MPTAPQPWLTEALRDALRTLARRRVPERDVEDVVQVVLAEAAVSKSRPDDPTSARRWLYGILRNKIADYHRKPAREELVESAGEGASSDGGADDPAVKSLLEWAVRELPPGMDARRTLEWLLRESEGETLEEIARSESVSPEQVRQRVSRLRRFFRERWAAQALALGLLASAAVWLLWPRTKGPEVVQANDPRVVREPSYGQLPAGEARDGSVRDASEGDAGEGGAREADAAIDLTNGSIESRFGTTSTGSVSTESSSATGSTVGTARPRRGGSGRAGFGGSGTSGP